jgi:hypothetical protein
MKKLLLVFIILIVIVLAVGCNARKKTVSFDGDSKTTTVVTTIDDDSQADKPLAINTTRASGGGRLAITSLDNDTLETDAGYHVVRGVAPGDTHRIKVNNYILVRYRPGQTDWSYIASTGMGTLRVGKNNYKVIALDSTGNTIDQTNFSILYAPKVPNLPGVGTPLTASLLISMILSFAWFGFKRFKRS